MRDVILEGEGDYVTDSNMIGLHDKGHPSPNTSLFERSSRNAWLPSVSWDAAIDPSSDGGT